MKTNMWLVRPMVLAVSSCFSVPSWANPTVPQVIQGSASFQGLGSNNLTVRNSPGAVINWQGFSIGAGQVTTFAQQSAASAVLNRVVGADISRIHGQLLSNGRVFLINPAGILIGAGGIVDTAGFVGSTLNMLDADFLAGRLKFEGGANSGNIVNQGWIRTGYGGNVVLVAPHIENSGLIQTPGGELLLAAGQKLTIGSLDPNGVEFEIQAPTDSVLNVGRLIAQGGAVGVFAGTLRHSGDIRADALVRDEAGRVVLKAQAEATLAAGSTTSASGRIGGDVLIESAGSTSIAGAVSAAGSAGRGGDVKVFGEQIAVAGGAVLDASGSSAGGRILVGGDYQGANASIQNARTTTIAAQATLSADAIDVGDGGRIIVWADGATRFEGSLSAHGGARGGNGGFAEVSGKESLVFAGAANLGAANGRLGDLLLDPLDAYVFNAGGLISQLVDELTDFPATAITVTPATLAAVTGNVTLAAGRYLRINDPISLTTAGQSFTAQVAAFTPGDPAGSVPNRLDIAGNITTNAGNVALSAPTIQSLGARSITTAGGAVALNATGAIQAGAMSINASGATGPGGAVTAAPGTTLQLGAVSGASFSATTTGFMQINGAITTSGGPVTLMTLPASPLSNSLSTQAITTSGGAVALTANNASVSAGAVSAGNAAVSMSGTSVSDFAGIDTTGSVMLNATAGSISATVNNAASVNATSTASFGTSINLSSTTALNATNVVANAPTCGFACSATIFLNATGDVNVGTVRATGTSVSNSAPDSVTISSNGGSIRGMSGAPPISATDVTLSTAQGSGGGIAGASPLNVDARRTFTFRPNGAFDVNLVGAGPNRLVLALGTAATGANYSGTLRSSAGTVTLDASADPTTVTVSNFAVNGFDDRVFNTDPFISLNVPNGNLVATTVTIPRGDTRPSTIVPPFNTAGLPVSVSALGNLTVNNYTRAAGGLAKSTSFSSTTGSATLVNVNASRDSISVSAATDVSIGTLTTAGSVSASAFNGNMTLGQIDNTSGTGSVFLSAGAGTVGAAADSVALEVLSGSTVSITGQTIGVSAFANPFDVAGSSVTLTSQNTGGMIGGAGKPVIANTQNLIINAATLPPFGGTGGAQFNVSTGPSALRNLTVVASPGAVGSGGQAQVRTEVGQPNDRTYVFASDGANFSPAIGAVPSTQFAGGVLSFTSGSGNITLGNTNLLTGSLTLNAAAGSITTGALDGAGISLLAGTSSSGSAVNVTTGIIGANVRPDSVGIVSGGSAFSGTRAGSIETRSIQAGTVDLTTFSGNIKVGASGTDDIGSVATRAGAVTLQSNATTATSGSIQVGNVFAESISGTALLQPITTGNLNVTGAIGFTDHVAVSTGTLDAASIVFTNDGGLFSPFPQVVVGTVGAQLAPTTLTLNGEAPVPTPPTPVGVAVRALGPVTAAPGAVVNIHGIRRGGVVLGGPVTAGAGSTINVSHRGADPFRFSALNAGADGTVNLFSLTAIEQTADGAGNGITGARLDLASDSGPMTNTIDPAQRVDLNTVSNLTVRGADAMRFDVHANTLRSLRVTKSGTVAAAPFELANLGSGQVVTMSAAPSDMTLTVQSPTTPLDFNLAYNSGGITLASGVVTSGGNVTLLASGLLNATTGGITTGGGFVSLQSNGGNLNTGAIDTTPATGTGGSITANANCGGCNLVVDGNLNTGVGGAVIDLRAGASVVRSGSASIRSDSSVNIFASDGDIGTSGAPVLVTTPRATINARDFTAGGPGGLVFATLTGTTSLDLTGDNGFNVSADTALQSLTLTTKGSGAGVPGPGATGTLNLSAAGQTYAFDRPTADLFGTVTNTFRVSTAGGATALSDATFRTSDGDLLVTGGATLNTPNLTLGGLGIGTGDVKLQGNAANPLVLDHPTQTVRAPRDLLIRGNVSLSSSGTQDLFAVRDVSVQAEGGTISLTAAAQDISTRDGSLSFIGGSGADETVTVSASTRQRIGTPDRQGGNVLFRAGAGDRANVNVVYTGPDTANVFEQLIEVRGNINIEGGAGANSRVTISTATGDQVIRAGDTSDTTDLTIGSIVVAGGRGAGSDARVVNTGPGIQRVGESTCNTGVQGCPDFPHQTRDISVLGGGAAGSTAAITATNGPQQIYSRSGTIAVQGGSAANATATIASTSTIDQYIGLPTYLGAGRNRAANVTIAGGTGAGAAASVTTPALQRVTGTGTLALAGNAVATGASATLAGAGQDIRVNAVHLTGGGAVDSSARMTSTATQTFCGSGFSGTNCTAGSSAMSSLVLMAGGVSNTGAVIQGHNQVVNVSSVQMTGGTAADPGTTSDAVLRNLSGDQRVTGNGVMTLTGGHQQSTTGVVNEGTGVQTVSASSIVMRSDVATAPAQSLAFVRIQNQPATMQTITTFGGISLQNSGGGPVAFPQSLVELGSAGPQRITAQFVDVTTAAGAGSTGNARITAAGNQWISTANGGIQVAAFGSGEASIVSGATQLLEVDYPGFMQASGASGLLNVGRVTQRFAAADAAGNSRIEAVDQAVFAGGVLVKGPTGAGNTSRLSASGTQTISTLLTGVQVAGGTGAGSLATIDPTTQTIIGNGGFGVLGGGGPNANAIIASQGVQQLVSTNSPMTLTGGTANGASAIVLTTAQAAQLISSGPITLTAGSAPDADALFITGSGTTPGAFTVTCNGCATPTLFGSNPQGNGVADAGAVGSWNNIPFTALTVAAASAASTPDGGSLVATEHDRLLNSLPDENALFDFDARRRQYQQCN